MKGYVIIVSLNQVIVACFARKMACLNWMRDSLPPAVYEQIKSYPQFCRDMNNLKTLRLTMVGNSFYEVKPYMLIKRYEQGAIK